MSEKIVIEKYDMGETPSLSEIEGMWSEWADGDRNCPIDDCIHCEGEIVLLYLQEDVDYNYGITSMSARMVLDEKWVHSSTGNSMCCSDKCGAYPKGGRFFKS